MIKIGTNHRPIYCRECRNQSSFERNPDKDIKTELGQAFMLSWKCPACGHTTLMTNPNYEVPAKQVEGKEVMQSNKEKLALS